jgi:hypothetical protein
MATLGSTYPTIIEVSKEFGVDGQPLTVAEMLSQHEEALDDIPWIESNSTTGHRIAVESGLPDSVFRKLNQGISPSKGTVTDFTESVCSIAQLGIVDKLIADSSGNSDIYRLRKNNRAMESMKQKFMNTLFYGDTATTPESFLGLLTRYSVISGGGANKRNIIDAGGTGTDNMSIALVKWGPGGVYGIYPKGSQAGLVHRNYGEELNAGADGTGLMPTYRDWFEWNCGIAVEDWRNVVRICNIDASDLTKDAASGADLVDLMIQAEEMIDGTGRDDSDLSRLVWYVPGRVRTFLRRQMLKKSNVWITPGEIAGKRVTMFDNIPLRKVDKLTQAESRVV